MSRLGLMSYDDDPDTALVKIVALQDDDPDSELDNPRWWVEGIDTSRPVRMDKVGVEAPATQDAVRNVGAELTLPVGLEEAGVFAVDPNMAIVETVVCQPGEKTWSPPQSLIDAMARLKGH